MRREYRSSTESPWAQLLKGEWSVQSDIFALGKLLSFFYEGMPPYYVKPIIRRATRAQPGDRYATANDFAAAIRHRHRPLILCVAGVLLAAAGVAFTLVRDPQPVPEKLDTQYRAEEKPGEQGKADEQSTKTETEEVEYGKMPDEGDGDYLARMMPLAEAGDSVAQTAVAEAYFYGRGTETNREVAVSWYRLAADAGNADAQASLGLCLFRGWGCEKNLEEAADWYGKAAEQGNLGAMTDLAFCCLNGFGVEKDLAKGFDFAMKAALRGHAPAQTLVGECYLEGLGVEADEERGEMWLYRAARQDNKRAQMLLRYR